MLLYRFRFPHFACSVGALGIGVALGRIFFNQFGGYIDGTNTLSGAFFPGFFNGFFITLVPLLALILLSFTVYAAPCALAAVILECAQDTYYILSAWHFLTLSGTGVLLPCVFLIGTRAFFTYCYLLAALRTLLYRSQIRLMPGTLSTVCCPGSRKFYRDYTALAGLLCTFALFAHAVFRF